MRNFPQFVVIHTVKGFWHIKKSDVCLEPSCFFDDPTDVDNFISGSSAFSKSSLNILKFTVHVLLKPGLENFEHHFANMCNEYNWAVVWICFVISFLWDWNETDLFQSCGDYWVFQICCHIECNTLIASSFRVWNSSTWIPSPPLALFILMLPKVHLYLFFNFKSNLFGLGELFTWFWYDHGNLWVISHIKLHVALFRSIFIFKYFSIIFVTVLLFN